MSIQSARNDEVEARAWAVLHEVADPEIPAVSIVDLGIVRYVRASQVGLEVGLTPTYSGCPAVDAIKASVRTALRAAGFADVVVRDVLSPPWTSDWMSEQGRRKLRDYGIAPPQHPVFVPRELMQSAPAVPCPRCGSMETRRVSEFGSTPCKAHYRCLACLEPFDHFKCH